MKLIITFCLNLLATASECNETATAAAPFARTAESLIESAPPGACEGSQIVQLVSDLEGNESGRIKDSSSSATKWGDANYLQY